MPGFPVGVGGVVDKSNHRRMGMGVKNVVKKEELKVEDKVKEVLARMGNKTKVKREVLTAYPFPKKSLPGGWFLAELRGFDADSYTLYFIPLEGEAYKSYGFMIKGFLDDLKAGRIELEPLVKTDVVPGKYVLVVKGQESIFRGVIIEDGDKEVGGAVTVRDVDMIDDVEVKLDYLYELPKFATVMSPLAFRGELDGLQYFYGTKYIQEAFQEGWREGSKHTTFYVQLAPRQTSDTIGGGVFTVEVLTSQLNSLNLRMRDTISEMAAAYIPPPGTKEYITITHYFDNGTVFYQAMRQQEALIRKIDEFDLHVRREFPTIKALYRDSLSVESLKRRLQPRKHKFAVLYEEDWKYYRAEVVDFSSETGVVEVQFIDHGNIQKVKIEELIPLDYFEAGVSFLPPLARAVKLTDVTHIDPKLFDLVVEKYPKIKVEVFDDGSRENDRDPLPAKLYVDISSDPEQEELISLKDAMYLVSGM